MARHSRESPDGVIVTGDRRIARKGDMEKMFVELTPEPPEELRAALVQLLERELTSAAQPSAWWTAGAREGFENDDEPS
jgi:hypothetical protein